MVNLLLAVLVAVVAIGVAFAVQRRRVTEAPTQSAWEVPRQLDRADFDGAGSPWLVAVFASSSCGTCQKVSAQAAVLASDQVAVDVVDYTSRADLHRRYHIDAVPIVVVADAEGVVQASFVGPMSSTDLWAAVAEVREPGSTPSGRGEGCASHAHD